MGFPSELRMCLVSSVGEVSLSQSPGRLIASGTPEVGWRLGEAGRKCRKPQGQEGVTNLKSHLLRSVNTLGEGTQGAGHSGIVGRVWRARGVGVGESAHTSCLSPF